MAMFASKVVTVFTMMIVMGLTVQGVPVKFGNMLQPLNHLMIHCMKDKEDQGYITIQPRQVYSLFLPAGFHGKYICEFSTPGKPFTTFDAINSVCNCDTYYGCNWVAKKDGFYCNDNIIYKWGKTAV